MKNKNALKWLSEVTGKRKLHIILLLVLQMVYGVMSVGFALFLKRIIDCAAEGNKEGLQTSFLLLVGLVAGQLILGVASRFLEEYTRASLENAFKQRFFDRLLRKEYADFLAVHSGEWMNRLTSDTAVCANGVVGILPGAMGMLVRMVGALIALLVLAPEFAYILIPGGVLLLLLTYSFRKVMKRLHKNVQEADGRLRSFLQEHLGSMLIVRAFAVEEQTGVYAQQKMEEHKGARMNKNRFSNICNAGFFGAMNGMYLFGIGYCGYGIMTGAISYGTFTAILQLIGQVQSPFAGITGVLPRFYAMLASAERLMEVESALVGKEYSRSISAENAGQIQMAAGSQPMQEGILDSATIRQFYEKDLEAIIFENVNFAYGEGTEQQVIEQFQMEIRKGEYVALTGQSGCGKSTLFKLMMSLYPLSSGRRYLRSRDGREQELDPTWRRLFAYVPQENYLMSGTVREIVSLADPTRATQEEALRRALRIACAEEFIYALEKGVDTVLGERGQGLSEGQMQRIAIARAIYSECPILLLDEATSALDEATEQRVLQNLKELTDKTVLIITHRPAALALCDKELRFGEKRI